MGISLPAFFPLIKMSFIFMVATVWASFRIGAAVARSTRLGLNVGVRIHSCSPG